MTIGLSSEQLLSSFSDSIKQRNLTMTVEMFTAELGINPRMADLIKEIKRQVPDVPPELTVKIINLLLALMDTIVSNNKELAKVVPHVEI